MSYGSIPGIVSVLAASRRVERLEEKVGSGKRIVVLFANDGETARECIVRQGHDPEEREIQYVVVARGKGDASV
jgi:hypothetical protein